MSEKIPSTMSERNIYFRNLTSDEGRNGIRVPKSEFDPTLRDPADNLLNFFRAFHSQNGRSALPDIPYEHQTVLPATGEKPATVLSSYFRGISISDLSRRQVHLENYRKLKARLDSTDQELGIIMIKGDETDDRNPELLKLKRKILELEMGKIVSSSGDNQEGLLGRELCGVRGLEAHELLLPPDTGQSTRYRSFMYVGHSYFLEEEQRKYDLPESQGSGPQRFSRYGFRGKPEHEITYVWFDGVRIDPENFPGQGYIEQIEAVFNASVSLLGAA